MVHSLHKPLLGPEDKASSFTIEPGSNILLRLLPVPKVQFSVAFFGFCLQHFLFQEWNLVPK